MSCLVITKDVRNLIEKIKEDRVDIYAPLLDSGTTEKAIEDIIKNDINTVANSIGHITPTFKMMQDFYKSKEESSTGFQGFSGGADGSDTIWFNVGQRYGVKTTVYRPFHLKGDLIRESDSAVSIANRTLKRNISKIESAFYKDPNTRTPEESNDAKKYAFILRDWLQVKDADAVFAIGNLKKGKDYTAVVDGGTGWAVQMAIDNNKPVHVFDQEENVWKTWVPKEGSSGGSWVTEDTPTLTPKFAGIGTRAITDTGKQAIEDVFAKSIYRGKSYLEEELSPANLENTLKTANMDFKSTQEREDRVSLIARMFSALTTNLYNQAKAENPSLQRKTFIVDNLSSILEALQPFFDTDESYPENRNRAFQQIQDNWYVLLDEAFDIIHSTEGVALSAVDLNTISSDESESKAEEMEAEDSEYVTKDGWMIKAREVDLRDTLSEQVRKILNNIRRIDKNGNEETDDIGFPRYINPDYAHLKLIEGLSGIYSSDEFDSALKSLTNKYSWVNSIITAINDPNDTSLKPKFYNDLRREFVPWWIQVGNTTKQINRHPGIYYLLNDWRTNYEGGLILDEDSIYGKDNSINVTNGAKGLKIVTDLNNLVASVDDVEEIVDDIVPDIKKILNMVGIDFTTDEIRDTLNLNPKENVSTVINQLAIVFKEVSEGRVKEDADFINEFDGVYTTIAQLFNIIPEGSTLATFREVGKTYQSYTAPSYLGRLLNGIKSARWEEVFEKQFKSYRQFYTPDDGYKSEWLRLLTQRNGQRYRDILARKVVLHKDRNKFNDWDDRMYLEAMINEFFSVPDTEGSIPQAWYTLPLLSDAESAEFIKFIRYKTDENGTVEEQVISKLADEVLNEYERMKVVIARYNARKNGTANHAPIANFDIVEGKSLGGAEFKFFPALNTFTITDELAAKYPYLTSGMTFARALNEIATNHNSITRAFIKDVLAITEAEAFNKFLDEAKGLLGSTDEEGNIVASPIRKDSTFENDIKEYFYNNALAYTQMVRMTTTDLTFYKNLNDFQKRYKEVYGMTLRLYTGSKYGKARMKMVILKDIIKPSYVMSAVKAALDARVAAGEMTSIEADYIASQYKKINVTDAQGWRTLRSYRSILDMAGSWTPEMEEALENLERGTFSSKDFNIIWQTLKPFTFTQNAVNSDVEVNVNGVNTAYGDIKVPMQIKNSEAILMAIYNTIAASPISNSPTLRALQTWMDARGVDVVNFESAIKAGLQGPIDLSENAINTYIAEDLKRKEGTSKEGIALTEEEAITGILDSTAFPNNAENFQIIKNIDYEDVGIQSSTTEHLLDHDDDLPSQFKKLIMADLPEDAQFTIPGVKYTAEHPYTTKQELYDLYQSCLTENILDGFRSISKEFEDIEKVAELIEKEMKGNARYSDEERMACKLVERDGKKVFNIPLYDPIFGDKIQNLLFSIIKKQVTKQDIKRASVVQASSWGTSGELNIRYKDSEGALIFNRDEFEGKSRVPKSQLSKLREVKSKFKTFEAYDKQFGDKKARAVAYYEAYLPAYSKSFFNTLIGEDGTLDINKLPEDLRRVIGMRVPTEDKYSMQPIYIKGFLPTEMGSVVMLPEDITLVVGSDFDVDKVYILLPEFTVERYDFNKALADYKENWYDPTTDSLLQALLADNDLTFEDLEDDPESPIPNMPKSFKEWFQQHKSEYLLKSPRVKRVNYNYSKHARDNKRAARNNAIIDVAWSVLTNEKIIPQITKPGGFDEVSRVGAIMTILQNTPPSKFLEISGERSFEGFFNHVMSLDKDRAKEIAERVQEVRDPLSPSTQLYFHSQNANGGKMIPVYAVANAAHAEGQWANIELKNTINVFGTDFKKIDAILSPNNERISNSLGQFLAGSVDNVKDPVLKALNQSQKTGATTALMLRLGMSIKQVGLLMTAPYMNSYYKGIAPIPLTEENVAWATNTYNNLEITSLSENDRTYLYGVLNGIKNTVDKLTEAGQDLRKITSLSRGDVGNAAGGPTVGHVIIRLLKLQELRDNLSKDEFTINSDLLDLDFLLDGTYDNLEECYNSGVPFLQAATKCGVIGPMYLLQKYFPQFKPEILDLLINKEYGLARYVDLLALKEEDAIKTINKFFSEFYIYNLSGTEYFGKNGSSDDTRTNFYQYAINFPEYFRKMRETYPELKINEFTSKLEVNEVNKYNVVPKIKFRSTGNLSKHMSNKITKDWQMLQNSPNEEVRKLGYQLFKYSSLFGLTYTGPQSFSQRAPIAIRATIPDYTSSLESILEATGEDYTPYINQFVRNNILFNNSSDVKAKDIISRTDEELILPKKYNDTTFVRIPREGRSDEYDYYTYVSGGDDTSANCTFVRITPLGHTSGLKEYYYGLNQVDTVIPHKEAKSSEIVDPYADSNIEAPVDLVNEEGITITDEGEEYAKDAPDTLLATMTDVEDKLGNRICFIKKK